MLIGEEGRMVIKSLMSSVEFRNTSLALTRVRYWERLDIMIDWSEVFFFAFAFSLVMKNSV